MAIQPFVMPLDDYYDVRGLNYMSESLGAVGYSWPWGGMGEYAVLNDYNVAKLPDSVSDEQTPLCSVSNPTGSWAMISSRFATNPTDAFSTVCPDYHESQLRC